jgi:HK97 family phage portal protein
MSVATVSRCVHVICESIASLPVQYMKVSNGIYVEDKQDPFHYMMTVEPCMNMNAHDFWYGLVRQLLFYGNAYIFPRYDLFGDLSELVLCGRRTVAHDVMNGTYTINDTFNGVCGTYGEREVIHIMANSKDGLTSHGIVVDAWLAINTAHAGDVETKNRFVNGGNVRGFVTNDKGVTGFGQVQDDELQNLAVSLDDQFGSGHHICSLPGDSDFKQVSMSSTDMQFLESRKFQIDEICRFFGVNPSFAFSGGSTNYKDAEQAYTNFLTFTLNPYLRRIETELNRKLVPRSMCCRRVFRFDRSGIYAMDQQSKAVYFKKMMEIGAMTANEIRAKENMPSVEGGDIPLVSANLLPLDTIREAKGISAEPKNGGSND